MREASLKMSELINSLGKTIPGMGAVPGPLDKLLGAKLPAALSFRLSLLIDEVMPPAKRYEERREAVVKDLAPDGYEKLDDEAKRRVDAQYAEEMEALGDEVVPIKVPQLKVSDLGEREILTPAEFRALRWLFAEEEGEARPNGEAESAKAAAG